MDFNHHDDGGAGHRHLGTRRPCAQQCVHSSNQSSHELLNRGSAAAEFVLVSMLIVSLFCGLVQLAFAMYVRNVLVDAASEGVHFASLADQTVDDGIARARDLITTAVGPQYAASATGSCSDTACEIRIAATLPLIGLFGIPQQLTVVTHAPRESFQ